MVIITTIPTTCAQINIPWALKEKRILNNLNNSIQQNSKAPHSPTRLIGDPAARNNTASDWEKLIKTTISTTCAQINIPWALKEKRILNNLNNLIQQLIPLATTQRAAREMILHHSTQHYTTPHQAQSDFGESALRNGLWRWWRVG